MLELGLPSGDLTVLCVGAHPDDIEIGCGGTLLRLKHRHARVTNVVFTGSPQRQEEALTAGRLFCDADVKAHTFADGLLPETWGSVKRVLEELASQLPRPGVIFAPRTDDAHQDHRLLGRLVTTVWRDSLVLHYDIPKWDGDFRPANAYVPLSEELAAQKMRLLHEAFPSQAGRDWWDNEVFRSVLRLRGVESRNRYAEAFLLPKSVLNVS